MNIFKIIVLFIVFGNIMSCSSKNNDSNKMFHVDTFFVPEITINTQDKIFILTITNNNNDTILLPEWITQGFLDDNFAEVRLLVKKRNFGTNEYEVLPYKDVDYDYYTGERKNFKVNPFGKRKYHIELDMLYNIADEGEYKVMAIINLSTWSKIETEWLSFSVKSE